MEGATGAALADGRPVTTDLVCGIEDEEPGKLREALGEDTYAAGRFGEARQIFERVAMSEEFVPFLTIPAYDMID